MSSTLQTSFATPRTGRWIPDKSVDYPALRLPWVQLAKAKGVYKGRKQEMTADTLATIKGRIDAGEAKAAVAKDMKISRDTLYRYFPVK